MVTVQRFGPSGLYTQSTVTSASTTSGGCELQSWGLVWVMVPEVKHKVGRAEERHAYCR